MNEVLVKEQVVESSSQKRRNLSCKERIKGEYRRECERLTALFAVMYNDNVTDEIKHKFEGFFGVDVTEDIDSNSEKAMDALCNYGLSIEYVLPDYEAGVRKGFLRWLISWGGPSDEWRFYFVPGENEPYKIEYIFADWYDSAKTVCTKGRVTNLLWDWLNEIGTPMFEYEKAKKLND